MKALERSRWWRLLGMVVVVSMLIAACGNINNGTLNGTPPAEDGTEGVVEPTAPSEPAAEEEEGEATPEPTEPTEGEGAEATPEEGEPEETPGEEQDLGGAAAPLNPDVSGSVEFWHFWGSPVRRSAIRAAVAMCEQELPNIDIEEVFKPFGDIWTANVAAVAAGSGMPDLIVEDRPQLPQRAADNVATNLQPYVDESGMDPAQFWDFTWEEALYEGEVYGIPFETDVRVLFWNKQAFEEAGLDPEVPPETWDEMWEYADALDIQNEDGSYERIGIFPLWSAGADIWALTNGWVPVQDGQPAANDPAMVEAVAWINEWIDRYGGWQNLQNYQAQFSAPPNDLFMSGSVAMLVDVAGYHSILSFYRPRVTLQDGSDVNMEWGIGPIPYNVERADWSGGFALSIPRGAENADAAWEVIKCLSGPEVQIAWARATYAIPTNRDAAYDSVLTSDPYWEDIVENMEWSQGTTYVPEYPNWTEQLWPRLEEVWAGEVEPEAALNEAQEAVDAEMGR